MKNNDFFKQFQAIGYNMARKAKSEVKEINNQKEKRIKEINSEFITNLTRDLREKTENFLRNYETQLNQQISENVKDLNLKILSKKNTMFEDYAQSLINQIQSHIEDNYDSYIKKMVKEIDDTSKIFKNTVYIQLNQRDKNQFPTIQKEIGNKKLQLEPKILDCIGGFKISNRGNTITVSNTIEDLIQARLKTLRMIFAKIFPEYSDRRKSATELMKERNITISSSLPKELEDYMLKYNIEFPER
ncbi:MAG: V-type ATP synthase subunit E [Candidatus Lokiarchaeota archaeon]|nr:V-type ATP synthase subunit E [Candidatus Lokiarchaeota archaeon]